MKMHRNTRVFDREKAAEKTQMHRTERVGHGSGDGQNRKNRTNLDKYFVVSTRRSESACVSPSSVDQECQALNFLPLEVLQYHRDTVLK